MSYGRLKSLGKGLKPYDCISMDCETDSQGDPYVWCVWGHRKGEVIAEVFYDKRAVVEFLFHKDWSHTVLTGVNILFDLNTLFYKGGFDWKIMSANGHFISASPPESWSKKQKEKALTMIDLGNFFVGKSLKTLAEMHKIGDVHIDKHILGRHGNVNVLTEACMSHCKAGVLIFEQMQSVVNTKFLTRIETTPSRTAQLLHQRHYLLPKAQILGKHDQITDGDKLFWFTSFHGGRNEHYVKGLVDGVTSIDKNSMYPYVMAYNPFPDLTKYNDAGGIEVNQLLRYLNLKDNGGAYLWEGLARVAIIAPKDIILPVLPYARNDKILFPAGKLIGAYTFPELRAATAAGYEIVDVYRCGVAPPLQVPLFRGYVEALYLLKQDPLYKKVAKLMLNGLYGKWAQKANETTGWQPCDKLPQDTDLDDNKYRIIDGLMFEYISETPIDIRGFKSKSYPLIASYVTAYARLELLETMKIIGYKYLYYCDTDSIYCDHERLMQLVREDKIEIHPTKLGAWDVEKYSGRLDVRGLKYYRIETLSENKKQKSDYPGRMSIEWHHTNKGVPARFHERYWENRTITYKKFVKYSYGLRANMKLNTQYTFTRSDQTVEPKREFISNLKSIPIIII